MKGSHKVGWKIKVVYFCIIGLFASTIFITNYAFKRSRNLLISQEAGIIAQNMENRRLALSEVIDLVRKISAASSTNKQVVDYLKQDYEGHLDTLENVNRIRSVEAMLSYYSNILIDYPIDYMILGIDGTIYSVTEGVRDSAYFSRNFADNINMQQWFIDFRKSGEVSRWIAPCAYDDRGNFLPVHGGGQKESYILFIRYIYDYNSQNFLGISLVSFPVENFSQILKTEKGASIGLFNEKNELIYTNGEDPLIRQLDIEKMTQHSSEGNGYLYQWIDEKGYLLNQVNFDQSGWKLVSMKPLDLITRSIDQLYQTISTMMFWVLTGAVIVCWIMYIYISVPLNRLLRKISKVNIGGKTVASADQLNKSIYGIAEAEQEISKMLDYMSELSAQAIRQKEIEENLRFEMLRAQLTPHFLFNTLNTIKWSAMISGASNIANMITSLGILLENSMNRREEEISLLEEIKLVKAWLEIKNWSLRNKIKLETDLPKQFEEVKVIKFCLQPLVENAVFHGIEKIDNRKIWLKVRKYYDKLYISIKDNGVGVTAVKLDEIIRELDDSSKKHRVTGIGLASIHELMKTKYGAEYGLFIKSRPKCGTKVYVVLPYTEVEKNAESGNC